MTRNGVRLADATVAVVGVGLMGGSLLRAIDGACARRIGTWLPGHAPGDDGERWMVSGLVDEATSLEVALPSADLVVLAVPTLSIAKAVPVVAGGMRDGAVLTDLGSCKAAVVAAMDGVAGGVACVGGHPMCGRETPGAEHADATLYRNARWAIVRASTSTEDAVALCEQLARAAGAEPIEVEAGHHDHIVALTSHAPYAIAQALAHAVDARRARGEQDAAALVGGGLQDALRLARGDVQMWRQILAGNEQELRLALRAVEDELSELRSLLAGDDPGQLDAWLAAGRRAAVELQPGGTPSRR